MTKPVAVFDSEVFQDYYLVMFRNVATGQTVYYEQYKDHPFEAGKVLAVLRKFTLVSFNGINFDVPILSLALQGASNARLKECCNSIIDIGMKPWHIEELYQVRLVQMDHIDLFDVSPGMASLKIYGGRLHCRRMQDLPIDPASSIFPEDRARVIAYCGNDLETTQALYLKLLPQIELRQQMSLDYGQDLRSKSDPAIAEAVIKSQITQRTQRYLERPTIKPGALHRYRPPVYIGYKLKALQEALSVVCAAQFVVSDSGKFAIPDDIASLKIPIGGSVYRMGIGGLHSSESSIAHVAGEDFALVDRDVASYYPAIILQGEGVYPRHLGPVFLEVYRQIVARRLTAKVKGEKAVAESLKIVVNSSFGKMGSKWSSLYSPDLLIYVTMTGQLALLMLIEWLEMEGIPVISANTDGLVIKCPRHKLDLMDAIVGAWELCTGFTTEEARYAAIYSRDVNNYIALKEGGGHKAKGIYNAVGLQKNPVNLICVTAVIKFLVSGTPIEKTIRECNDITQFVSIRSVKGGAQKDGQFLGRAVRWYYATGVEGVIQYKVNGYAVARSEGARPLMELPDELPGDINYGWYIDEARAILADIGHA